MNLKTWLAPLIAVFALTLGQSALANIYDCDPLQDTAGNTLPGGIRYSVQYSPNGPGLPQNLGLLIHSGTAPLVVLSLPLTDIPSSEGAIYASAQTDVQGIFSIAPAMPGLPRFFLGVRRFVGGTEFRAHCQVQPGAQ